MTRGSWTGLGNGCRRARCAGRSWWKIPPRCTIFVSATARGRPGRGQTRRCAHAERSGRPRHRIVTRDRSRPGGGFCAGGTPCRRELRPRRGRGRSAGGIPGRRCRRPGGLCEGRRGPARGGAGHVRCRRGAFRSSGRAGEQRRPEPRRAVSRDGRRRLGPRHRHQPHGGLHLRAGVRPPVRRRGRAHHQSQRFHGDPRTEEWGQLL